MKISKVYKRFWFSLMILMFSVLMFFCVVFGVRNDFVEPVIGQYSYGHKVYLEPHNQGLVGGEFELIHVSPTNEEHLLAIGKNIHYVSLDAGESWSELHFVDGFVDSIQMQAYWDWDGTLLAMANNNLYWSNNQGKTWAHQYLGRKADKMGLLDDGRAFVRFYTNDTRPYTAHLLEKKSSGEYHKGKELRNVELVVPGGKSTIRVGKTDLKAVVTKTSSGRLWAATNRGVYTQTNAENPWEARHNGLDKLAIKQWLQHPRNDTHILLIDEGGALWQSRNFGVNWEKTHEGPLRYANWLEESSPERLLLVTKSFHFIFVDGEQQKEINLPENNAVFMLYNVKYGFDSELKREYFIDGENKRKDFEESEYNIEICQHRLTSEGTLEVELSLFCDLEGAHGAMWSYTKDGTWSISVRVNHSPRATYRTESFEYGSCVLHEGQLIQTSLEKKGDENRHEIAYQYPLVSRVERAGWHGDKYFALGALGILFGSKDEVCKPVYPSFSWTWSRRDWDSKQRYGRLYPENSLYWWEGETMHLLIPGQWGIWGVSLPRAAEERTWSLPKVLHTVSYDRWVQLSFVLLFIFVFLGVRERFYPGQLKRFLTRLQGGRKTPNAS